LKSLLEHLTPLAPAQVTAAACRFERHAQLVDADGHTIELPDAVYNLLRRIVEDVSEGHAVTVKTTDPILTTGKAADILNVSRVTLVKLLDDEVIPSFKRGSHRRVLLSDVLAYDARVRQEREAVFGELSYEAAHTGLDDATNYLPVDDD
jgi:excisionase family DNA binding protein